MTDKKEIEKLAELARVTVTDAEIEKFQKEITSILDYVSEIQKVETGTSRTLPDHRNVVRKDGKPHESGIYTDRVLREAPNREDGYVAVKRILKEQ